MTKKVFISYAHHDATPFASRLASELEHYYDTFWDNKLQAGAWSLQLETAIRSCDAFVVVMSNEREKSPSCKWELELAQDQLVKSVNQLMIILVQAFRNYVDAQLTHLQYVNFTLYDHYDEGFRRLTRLISGERLSAWEYLGDENADKLLQHLKEGRLPGLIAREFGDWIVVDKLWDFFYNNVFKKYQSDYPMYRRTPRGVLELIRALFNIASFHSDGILAPFTQQMEKILKTYNDACSKYKMAITLPLVK